MFRSDTTNSSKDALTESSSSVNRVPENVTSKPEPSSPIIRRSDTDSYFSVSSFGPSTVLLPPLRYQETTQKYFDSSYSASKSDKPLYSGIIPALREGGRNNFDPPKNGGALAKTFNSFDSLLSSFIAAVTQPNGPTSTPGPSTSLPTPQPPQSSPETIVRSEIGRIHHDPVVITENFTIRLPNYRKPVESKIEKLNPPQVSAIAPLPQPSSTPLTPPKLSQNDYLAYFVEIEPKKPRLEDSSRRGGFYLNVPSEDATESKNSNLESLEFPQGGQSNFERPKSKPYSEFVRSEANQKFRGGSTLSPEAIAKALQKKEERQRALTPLGTVGQPYQPVGKWIIAKDEKSGQYQVTSRPNPFEAVSRERSREPINYRGSVEVETETETKENAKETAFNRGSENFVNSQPITEEIIKPTTISSGPYKFLYVALDGTTEESPSASLFGRTNENDERNRFAYKTNPESRARARYFEKNRDSSLKKESVESSTEISTEIAPSTYNPTKSDDSIKFIYKTNPETRNRNRFLGSSEVELEEKKLEDPEVITPKILVPIEKPDEPFVTLNEKPIQVYSLDDVKETESIVPKRRKNKFRSKSVEIETSSRKPSRSKPSTESPEAETVEENSEDDRKPLPRRIVKVHRNDSKNQRLAPVSKLKRVRKPLTKSSSLPIVVLEDLEDKSLSKENEIHPTYRPIVVADNFYPGKNKSRFRFTVEDEKDFGEIQNNKIPSGPTTEKLFPDSVTLPSPKPEIIQPETENDVPDKEVTVSEKPLIPILKRPQTIKNVTQIENRATTKAYRGKFKPSENFKLR